MCTSEIHELAIGIIQKHHFNSGMEDGPGLSVLFLSPVTSPVAQPQARTRTPDGQAKIERGAVGLRAFTAWSLMPNLDTSAQEHTSASTLCEEGVMLDGYGLKIGISEHPDAQWFCLST